MAVASAFSTRAAGAAARASLSPAGLGAIAAVLGVLAAVWFAGGDLRGAVAGSLLLGAVLLTDRVGHALAGLRSDALADRSAAVLVRSREYAVYAGLAVGGVPAGIDNAWAWAAGALIALALRDTAMAAGTAPAAPAPPRSASVAAALDTPRPAADLSLTRELLGDDADDGGRRSGAYPAPPRGRPAHAGPLRVLVSFPEPVRFALIAATAVLTDARVTFIALITGCAIAATAALVDPRREATGR